ncbi:hypothetical protein BDE36_0234 [Arcticibacter tournemirensis]|uniref:DUF4890 domain-containing protein n=1 Tax=Arcticibacter tournemirensis TaxID=699437 RepID=A0A5M9GV16_9SPHI|nr:hypothetical protein [Arcticibacter tournemirensis]KAA8478456.1 hypothetical protein F1649_17890 [Arcticibacter tournemirensis]TQM48549.1 hypothetical protein BDE36_0234 [Arcticibacter tournemirensis]
MKKLIPLIACMFLLSGMSLRAQTKMTDEQRQETLAKFEEFKTKLNLTDEQETKVKSINSEFFNGLSALKSSGESKMAKYKKFSALRSKRDAQMKETLNDDQYKEYKKFQSEMKENVRKKRKQK